MGGVLLLLAQRAAALDNGLRVPPMGWSSWYGFKTAISETVLREMGEGMVSSGLRDVGYRSIWLDDGWAVGRDKGSGKIIEDLKVNGLASESKLLREFRKPRDTEVVVEVERLCAIDSEQDAPWEERWDADVSAPVVWASARPCGLASAMGKTMA